MGNSTIPLTLQGPFKLSGETPPPPHKLPLPPPVRDEVDVFCKWGWFPRRGSNVQKSMVDPAGDDGEGEERILCEMILLHRQKDCKNILTFNIDKRKLYCCISAAVVFFATIISMLIYLLLQVYNVVDV